ncbi:hypothetical protein [Comamonas thiooxydans]|uniref:hypothetical protein n=1 Tax=Comamonas thiooxydans TaxID=363952 RepID=UPI001CCC91ED|nr:hypothetical protein [Comamonas thiooxydans]UBQ43080.1 hypothetical protein LCH15_06130 [Comamonas thiooxydans]
MSKTVRTSSISPPPGQQDQSARLAASAEVGQVEGTTQPADFRELFRLFFDMPSVRLCMAINVLVLIVAVSSAVLPGMIAKTPFAVVTDWADFTRFVFLYWVGRVPA